MKYAMRIWIAWISVALACLLSGFPVRAQEEGSSAQDDDKQAAESSSKAASLADAGQDDQQPAQPTPGVPIDTHLRVMGSVAPFTGVATPLRWAGFSFAGTEYFNVHDTFDPGNGSPLTHLSLGLLRTKLIFDREVHKMHFAFQYSPQMAFLNGRTISNASANTDLNLATTFDITPRLSLLVRNHFTRNRTRQVFPQEILEIYRGVNGILPGDFLENDGMYWDDSFSLAINYKMSPRWTITMRPMVRYLSLNNDTLGYTATGRDIRNAVALTYALSPRSNLSILYSFESGHTIKPRVTNSYFHGAALFYSRQMAQSLWIQGVIGADVALYPNVAVPPVFLTGAFSVIKNFSGSLFAVSFVRDKQLFNYLTDRLSDRFDATYTVPLLKNLGWKNGIGYYHEIGARPRTHGKYGLTGLEYRFAPSLVLFTNYMFRFQHAETLQLLTGTHKTFTFGIRWEPPALAKK